MAQLIVRGVADEVKARLQARAGRRGQSMEAEVRDILQNALKDDRPAAAGLGTRITALFADVGREPGEELERPDWGEMKSPSTSDRPRHERRLGADA